MDQHALTLMTFRWLHFIFGITWIGLLYFFNFVNVATMKKLDAQVKSKLIPELMPRALWWFRWGAAGTVATGLAYILYQVNMMGSGYLSTGPGKCISIGATLGIIMFLNVWLIIWPNQKRIINATIATAQGTPAPAEMAGWSRKAYLASRTNTYLSFPMLFFMGATSHLPGLFQ